ncbi:MAG: hypothetical protein GF308_17110 [Candidatus Heimdallarchaeota archaeon]|nr:hypothetical protein [Candidatus Heimdallarchaeota archaeon]
MNAQNEASTAERGLPLILRNMKKAFGKNITGPIRQQEREFKASTKPIFLDDIAKFLAVRGVTKLQGITTWRKKEEIALAYHFIFSHGKKGLDSSLSIIAFILPKQDQEIPSLQKIFPIARMYEEDIRKKFQIRFTLE